MEVLLGYIYSSGYIRIVKVLKEGAALAESLQYEEAANLYQAVHFVKPQLIAIRNELAHAWLMLGKACEAVPLLEETQRMILQAPDRHLLRQLPDTENLLGLARELRSAA